MAQGNSLKSEVDLQFKESRPIKAFLWKCNGELFHVDCLQLAGLSGSRCVFFSFYHYNWLTMKGLKKSYEQIKQAEYCSMLE